MVERQSGTSGRCPQSTMWSLSPEFIKSLRHFLRQWHPQVLSYQVPYHNPSFKIIFVKHSSVLDIFCNHKSAVGAWASHTPPHCCCNSWSRFKEACLDLITGTTGSSLALRSQTSTRTRCHRGGLAVEQGLPI